jgi:phage major head subunit gpT-like protein
MGATTLSPRNIIGSFYRTLEETAPPPWVAGVSREFQSNQDSETYKWLGMSPMLREWIGGREAHGFRENGITVINKEFEATLEVLRSDLRRDKTGQVMVRIGELADRAQQHWAQLLTTLIAAGAATACYDGQFFFDTDHVEGDSGTQDNDRTSAIVAAANPTVAEMSDTIFARIANFYGFKDDKGQPMNEGARSFLVMVPVNMMAATAKALQASVIVNSAGAYTNVLANVPGLDINYVVNPRLTVAEAFYIFRTDGRVSPLIRQEEEGVRMKALAGDSEQEFMHNRHLYGVTAIRNVAYGYWQHAMLHTFTTA